MSRSKSLAAAAAVPGAVVTALAGAAVLTGAPTGCARGVATATAADQADAGGDYGAGVAADAAAVPNAHLRFANWAPDGINALNLCVVPHGMGNVGPWTGPVLKASITFPNVSSYVEAPFGAYDVAVISPTKGCGATVAAAIPLPTFAPGVYVTVALVGDIAPYNSEQKAQVVAFADDGTAPATQTAVRFVDALPGPSSVAFGTGAMSTGNFSALGGAVPFGAVSPMLPGGPAVDANGYMLLAPLTNATLSANDPSGQGGLLSGSSSALDGGFGAVGGSNVLGSGGGDIATASKLSLPAGAIVTIALIAGDFGFTPQLLLCQDGAPSLGAQSACGVLSP